MYDATTCPKKMIAWKQWKRHCIVVYDAEFAFHTENYYVTILFRITRILDKVQWLILDLRNGLFPLRTVTELIYETLCSFQNTRWWTRSRKPTIPSVICDHQNLLELIYNFASFVDILNLYGQVKLSQWQAVNAWRAVRCWGSHIFWTIGSDWSEVSVFSVLLILWCNWLLHAINCPCLSCGSTVFIVYAYTFYA
jgi:hypothetical protein